MLPASDLGVERIYPRADPFHPREDAPRSPVLPPDPRVGPPNPRVEPPNPPVFCFNPRVGSLDPGVLCFNPAVESFNPRVDTFQPRVLCCNPPVEPSNPRVRTFYPRVFQSGKGGEAVGRRRDRPISRVGPCFALVNPLAFPRPTRQWSRACPTTSSTTCEPRSPRATSS